MHRFKAVLVACVMLRLLILVAPLLLLTARSWRGRLEGLFGVVLSSLLTFCAIAVGYWVTAGFEVPRWVTAGAFLSFAALIPCSLLAVRLGRTCHFGTRPVGSHFLKDEPRPEQMGWADVEDEHVWLLTQLVTRLDPWMPWAEAAPARDRLRQLVDEVRTHPDYHRLGRVGDVQGQTLRAGRLDPHHCYTYRPDPRGPDERFGVLVFLHGHGGNFLVLLHALRPLADEHRLIVVCPTFGYGNWQDPGGVEAAERARRFALAAFDADDRRVYLAGLSQGGCGVSRAGAAHPGQYAGLIFLSATAEPAVVRGAAPEAWPGRRVLVLHGERDRNVHPRGVTESAELLRAAGADVTFHLDPDSGHFLFFAKHDDVLEVIGRWLRGQCR